MIVGMVTAFKLSVVWLGNYIYLSLWTLDYKEYDSKKYWYNCVEKICLGIIIKAREFKQIE